MNEKQLIDRVLKGDTSSFGYFVDTYQDMAVTIAYRVCGNRQDAEDIVQNAFVKAFHNLHTFRNTSKFSTWFYRIVYNTALTAIKSNYSNVEYADYHAVDGSDTFSDWDTISQMEEKERNAILDEAMKKLPPDESLLLTLYYLEENTSKEIIAITGLTDTNLKVKLHRARKRLGTILEPMLNNRN